MTELQEQYRLLEVSADVSFATLKQAYKDLVLVWHPDRFSDHPRLQKKAEEKLKCINLAYQEISAVYRGEKQAQPTNSDRESQNAQHQQQSHRASQRKRPPKDPFNRQQHRTNTRGQTSQHQTSKTSYGGHASGISLEQARFVILHFRFRTLQRTSGACLHFKSGPFKLDIHQTENWLALANLCDSINGFHPILLAIPCKASRLFAGAEAQQLMALFNQVQKL